MFNDESYYESLEAKGMAEFNFNSSEPVKAIESSEPKKAPENGDDTAASEWSTDIRLWK